METVHNRQFSLNKILTLFADLFFLWTLLHHGLGGWESAVWILTTFGALPWALLGLVVFLILYRSDYRTDVPLFLAGVALGYWGEWWGTTRGLWTYWNGATPPDYLPPLWGIGLLTVYRLGGLVAPLFARRLPRWTTSVMAASFAALPILGLAWSWPRLAAVDWRCRLDAHFLAGLAVGALLISYRFDLQRDFALYLCGTLLGGLYEYLGTSMGEWAYITGETPPPWIAPLWGLAAVAMVKLALVVRCAAERGWQRAHNRFLRIRAKTSS